MRMKAVCEATGLTDRTVRYYIEEGLITPDYTETYTGRKTFDFCESDIHQLNDIAVLRKFGFTVAEIRDMLRDPGQIAPTLDALRRRKQAQITEEQTLMLALDRLTEPFGTVAELALALSEPVETALVPAEDGRADIWELSSDALAFICRAALAWGPLLVAANWMILSWGEYEYANFRPKAFALLMAALVPSVMVLNWHKLRERFGWPVRIRKFLWVLCALSIPLCAFFAIGTFSYSETTDIRTYRNFDGRCIINRNGFFDEFFPTWPHYFDHYYNEAGEIEEVWLDAKYYYRFMEFMDYTYDVYAEWPLEQEEFDQEVARVTELFESTDRAQQEPTQYRGYVKLQKGPWTCLVLYSGQEPFVTVDNSYTYSIFAYDPDALRVRYIYCDSLENGMDQPYYLQLDWE